MRAIILAAGLGTRMRPLTDHLPKPLLQAGGSALIEYHLRNLAQAGIREIVINHFHLGERLEEALGDGSRYGVHIAWSREALRLETAGGIVNALPLLGDGAFAVVSGDIWTDYDFARLQRVDGRDTLARLVMVPNPPHHPTGDFQCGPAGRLRLRAPQDTAPGCTYSGVSVMHPALFAGLAAEPLPLRPVLDAAIAAGRVAGELFAGRWFDIGTPQRLQELDLLLRGA
jgi:MurNAc alpha-1-phosphate uridylyltransferase